MSSRACASRQATLHGMDDFKTLGERFRRLGIDTSTPGFYDDPAFLLEERSNPMFFEDYAHFVQQMTHSDRYLSRARTLTRRVSEFMYRQLSEDGRQGACIDASLVLGRFLERLGIWNVAHKGALSVFFKAGLAPIAHFAPIMLKSNPAQTGHLWLRVPPYDVVDVSIKCQHYSHGEADLLPDLVAAEGASVANYDAHDLMEPEAVADFVGKAGRLPTLEDVERMSPGLGLTIDTLVPREVELPNAVARYVPVGASALDGAIEDCRNLCLSGKYPSDLYKEFVAEMGRGTT